MFEQKVILLTGASGAVAGSIKAAFEAQGAQLVLLDRHTASQTSLTADVGKLEEAKGAIAAILEQHGRLDGVIHTVGGFAMQSIHDFSTVHYDRMLESNLRTTVNVAAAAMPALETSQGFFGAIAAGQVLRGGGAKVALYSAAKGAMVLFLKSLALEVKAVRFGVVYPLGAIDTPANHRDMPNADTSTWIDPKEIAEAFVYMASRTGRGQIQEIQIHPKT